MAYSFAGMGYKRTQLNLSIDRLKLDHNNIRFADEEFISESELIGKYLSSDGFDRLINSLRTHGYFDEEPLVVIPDDLPDSIKNLPSSDLRWNQEYVLHIHDPQNTFTVVEGNRRVAAIKAILNHAKGTSDLGIGKIEDEVMEDLSIIPSIIYSNYKEVLPYLAIKHGSYSSNWGDKEMADFKQRMESMGHPQDYIDLFEK
jgi:hypothetical protein